MKMCAASVLATLVLAHSTYARGLKQSLRGDGPEAIADSMEDLRAENNALKAQKNRLESMMDVAQADMRRMKLAMKRQRDQDEPAGGGGNAQVLNQEIEDLRKKLLAAEADKKELVQTLRAMLHKNSTKLFKAQADKAKQMQIALELQCGREQQSLQAQLQESQRKLQEAGSKCDDTKELAQTLQEQNMDLQKSLTKLQAESAKITQKEKDLSTDKANLVETMHGLMRDNTKAQQALQTEKAVEQKEAKELAEAEAKIAKLQHKPKPKKQVQPPARPQMKVAKNSSKHHEESMAAQLAHLKAIDHYLIRSAEAAAAQDDTELEAQEEEAREQAASPKPREVVDESVVSGSKLMAKLNTNEESGLRDWLGLEAPQPKKKGAGNIPHDANGLSPIDALAPEKVKKEARKEVQESQAVADDGGDGIAGLLAEAKEQLSAMDA